MSVPTIRFFRNRKVPAARARLVSEKDLNRIWDELMRQIEAEAWKKTCESTSFDVYESGSLFIELVHFHGVCRIDIYDSQSGWREKSPQRVRRATPRQSCQKKKGGCRGYLHPIFPKYLRSI